MPNHVSAKITIERYGKDFTEHMAKCAQVLGAIKGEQSDFDFNRIKPMPAELKATYAPARIVSAEKYDAIHAAEHKKWMEDVQKYGVAADEPAYSITQEMSDDWMAKYGADNWYDWARINWGTKWGAYTVSSGNRSVSFQTAWAFPVAIMSELSKQFSDVVFDVQYADEDYGHNCAMSKWRDGKEISRLDPDNMEHVDWRSFARILQLEVKLGEARRENRELREKLLKFSVQDL